LRQVRKTVNTKLINSQVNTPYVSKKEIIEEAANHRVVQVILTHRKALQRLREVGKKLLAELEEYRTYEVAIGRAEDRKIVALKLTLAQKAEIYRSPCHAADRCIPLNVKPSASMSEPGMIESQLA
jgi:hypothetical protein